jgi:hypothetical protein
MSYFCPEHSGSRTTDLGQCSKDNFGFNNSESLIFKRNIEGNLLTGYHPFVKNKTPRILLPYNH